MRSFRHCLAVALSALLPLAGAGLAGGAGALATAVLSARPAAAAGAGSSTVGWDIRTSETLAGTSTSFTIEAGQAADFSTSVYLNGSAKTFGQVEHDLVKPLTRADEWHFVLWYGWGVQGQPRDDCQQIGQGSTAYCEQVSSDYYTTTSGTTSWPATTPDVAPPGVTTLNWAVYIYSGPGPGPTGQPLLESNAGVIVANASGYAIDIEAHDPSGALLTPPGPYTESSGAQVSLEACIANSDTYDCANAERIGNFLGDYLYVCSAPPAGSGVQSGWWDIEAGGALGGIQQAYSPPAGQDWTFSYYAVVSTNSDLSRKPDCSLSGLAPYSVPNLSVAGPFQVTWQGPSLSPPLVALVATPSAPAANQRVVFTATAQNVDGNSALFICARSGTNWLTIDSGNGPYLASTQIPAGQQTAQVSGSAYGQDGTAQFVAYLSTATSEPATCPTGTSGYGTGPPASWPSGTAWQSSWDFSNIVNVTWPKVPVPPWVTLSVSPPNPRAGEQVALTADYGGDPGPAAFIYICTQSSTTGLSTPTPQTLPYLLELALPVTQAVTYASSPGGHTYDFVAFLSTKGSGVQGGPCPTAVGEEGATVLSNVVTVTWPAKAPPSLTPPSVSLSASSTDLAYGRKVVLTATYSNTDGNDVLYICARSGTGWLQVSGGLRPYLVEAPVTGVNAVAQPQGWAIGLNRAGGTAQFVAFLSHVASGLNGTTCPASDAADPAYGTDAPPGWPASQTWDGSWDFSNTVSVTWEPAQPLATVTLSAQTLSPSAGSPDKLTATYSGGDLQGAIALYICMYSSSGKVTVPGPGPYLSAVPVPTYSSASGTASGTGSTGEFIAFLSTEDNQQFSGTCPTSGSTDGAVAFSNTVTISWGTQTIGYQPMVYLAANTTSPSAGDPVTLTASYSNYGTNKALYICAMSNAGALQGVQNPPYLIAVPVPTYPDAAAQVTAPAGSNVTFVAYLSTEDNQQFTGTCEDLAGTNGTTSQSDWSNVVTVTWGTDAPPPTFGNLIDVSVSPSPPISTGSAYSVNISALVPDPNNWAIGVYMTNDPQVAALAQGQVNLTAPGTAYDLTQLAEDCGTANGYIGAPGANCDLLGTFGPGNLSDWVSSTTRTGSAPLSYPASYFQGSSGASLNMFEIVDPSTNQITQAIVGASIQVESSQPGTWYVGAYLINGGAVFSQDGWQAMAWGSPQVSLSVGFDGGTWTANPPSAAAGQTVFFTANATNVPPVVGPPANSDLTSYNLYICMLQPGPQSVSTSWGWPYLAAGVPVPVPAGSAQGTATGMGGETATFIAFLSTDPDYEGTTSLGYPPAGGYSCPSAPNGIPQQYQNNVLYVSNPITVTWAEPTAPPPPQQSTQWAPT